MFSAAEIAKSLGQYAPTAEQEAIIQAPPGGTYRVIAGAGSGKTETMAQRVLWLVANGHVRPGAILGLTFTRKAAGELGRRISERLGQMASSGMGAAGDEFDVPMVATYNSFASRLYREYAPLLGRDPDAQVLSEASAWGLARRVVVSSKDPALLEWEYSVAELTRVVRLLASRVSENSVGIDDVEAFATRFRTLVDLSPGGTGRYADVEAWSATVDSLIPMMRLVGDYTRAKQARGVLEFSDQVSLALELVGAHPEICEELRQQHQVVLLDEYQDTSVAQSALLSTLFPNHSVMAVGDPYQAIYGWRGASSSNLSDFETAFGDAKVETFSLSTSWRNGTAILDVANQLAGPLGALPGPEVGVLVPARSATSHGVEVVFEQSVQEEAESVAQWLVDTLAEGDTPHSAAILVRQRNHQTAFVDALVAKGVPVHVLGIGGLLDDPVVADVVCALRVMTHPHAETELVRLLAGGKWRLGVADLHALAATARWLEGRDAAGNALDDSAKARLKESVAPSDHAGLRDALSFIVRSPASHHQREAYTELGLARLGDVERTLRALNDAHLATVDDAIAMVERELGLDIELLAHPGRSRSVAAREALMDAVHTYLSVSDDASVHGFVQWLGDAESRDNLTPRQEPAEPGCVQVLTIHGSKGLEWDIVAIPRVVDDELPGLSKNKKGWVSRGELPYVFRGDRGSLPHFSWQGATTRKEAIAAFTEFAEALEDHRLAEERRLMYVAVTRAKHHLLVSGSFWASQQKPRGPSLFLRELEEATLISALPLTPLSETPPEPHVLEDRLWPGDPLGTRRAIIERAAQAVIASGATGESEPYDERLGLLRSKRDNPVTGVLRFPVRIPASALERLISDPEGYGRALLRPMPGKPQAAALRGTLFHRYVEERFAQIRPGVLFDPEGIIDDVAQSSLSIEQWRERFEASEFAGLEPVAIEPELHVPIGEHIIICKIDAVFPTASGVRIIDWKTGAPPTTPEELAAKSVQLAAYRLAWSQWSGLALHDIEAAFWFVETESLLSPDNLPDAKELSSLVRDAVARVMAPEGAEPG
jgi:DNA helicase-2/ATP-dependent DNA helicase PcrA